MRIGESCAACLYDQQARVTDDAAYLAEVKAILDARSERDTAPLMVYRFNRLYAERFGAPASYAAIKRKYNDFMLGQEARLRGQIRAAEDPLARALVMARIGNYIDFGASAEVSTEEFLGLFADAALREEELPVYRALLDDCAQGDSFLLIADNCGEIVLDKLLLEQLHARFPALRLQMLVRGGEVLNDATLEDAYAVGADRVAEIISSGVALPGTTFELLSPEARTALDGADVVLSKGQGNYESLSGQGRHAYYAFLCKCDLFTKRFQVPRFTGMLIEER